MSIRFFSSSWNILCKKKPSIFLVLVNPKKCVVKICIGTSMRIKIIIQTYFQHINELYNLLWLLSLLMQPPMIVCWILTNIWVFFWYHFCAKERNFQSFEGMNVENLKCPCHFQRPLSRLNQYFGHKHITGFQWIVSYLLNNHIKRCQKHNNFISFLFCIIYNRELWWGMGVGFASLCYIVCRLLLQMSQLSCNGYRRFQFFGMLSFICFFLFSTVFWLFPFFLVLPCRFVLWNILSTIFTNKVYKFIYTRDKCSIVFSLLNFA